MPLSPRKPFQRCNSVGTRANRRDESVTPRRQLSRPGLRLSLAITAVLLAIPPTWVFASPARPDWNPGPPWAPLACKSNEVCEISNLFWIMLAISGVIFIGVCTVLVLCFIRFSARPGAPEPTQIFGNRRVELIWTLIPTFILAVAFIATVRAMSDINNPSTNSAVFDVNAIGHQWWWEFQYPKYNIVTANEVHVPTGSYVHFHVESYDVIHSFWTPQLQRQIDANPGQDNAVFLKAEQPGVYSGACYEYCGEAHAWMKFREVVQSPADFQAWVRHEQQKRTKPTTALARAGEQIFLHQTCVNCHAINGTAAGGAVGPNLTHLGSRWTIGAGAAPMTVQDLEAWIRNPPTYKPGVVMPSYNLPASQLHDLAAYLISLK